MTVDELAYGFVQVANEAMCRPIRALTQVCVGPSGPLMTVPSPRPCLADAWI